jgi:riboflavin biosynthesis pyrimidine reductase
MFIAPKLLGKGLGWTSGLEIASLDQAVRLTAMHAERLEDDLLIGARPRFG